MKKMLRINNNKMTARVTETVQIIPEETLINSVAPRIKYRAGSGHAEVLTMNGCINQGFPDFYRTSPYRAVIKSRSSCSLLRELRHYQAVPPDRCG
jgi:hypothetical protein